MSDQISEWEPGAEPNDPYDNHADVRRELDTGQQAVPQTADQIFNEVMAPVQPTATQSVLSGAIKRIEQAKLYETLLTHDLFGEGSARVEIVQAVQAEIREFALNRLEILLGMKTPQAQAAPVIQSQFVPEEVVALRALAARMLKRDVPIREANPQIMPVMAASSAIPLSEIRAQVASISRPEAAAVPVHAPAEAPVVQPMRRPKRSQAVNPRNRPLPMPSNDTMNAQNAILAAKNEQAMGGAGGTLGTAVTMSLKSAVNKGE